MKKTYLYLTVTLLIIAGCGTAQKTVPSSETDDVISDGYMSTTTKDNTYSISKKTKDPRHYSSIYSLLETVSGVTVDGTVVRVRGGSNSVNGSNDPLFIVDGIERGISDLNPADVHSVEVIKDASASIYGMRGANGVIIITTEGAYQMKQNEIAARKAEKEARRAAKAAKRNK
ncbi:MAG: TonB-dependent receptor plug domain-containing protein [Bacteroidales bacterium]|nr:TonB-dependent receptor plug domain-containing protein [Bacteroidales bacterium]